MINAVGEVLSLTDFSAGLSVSGIDRHQARFASGAEAAAIAAVDDNAPGENHLATHFGNGDRQLAPMKQVSADGVSPAHMSPLIAEGVELEKEMILTLKVHEAIRIIRPMLAGREVYLGTIALLIAGLSAGERPDQHQ